MVLGLVKEIGYLDLIRKRVFETWPILQSMQERRQAMLAFRRYRIEAFANRGLGEKGDSPFCRKRLKPRLISLV